jgi:AcrR family transcriptional regulator
MQYKTVSTCENLSVANSSITKKAKPSPRVVPPTRQVRPTREETRQRLLEAAVEVFINQGIGAASIDHIAAAAGFSRGAVYSNFADKDELVMELLRQMTESSIAELDQILVDHPEADDYIRAIQASLVAPVRSGWNHHPVLATELTLWALRIPRAQAMLRDRLDRTQEAVWRALEQNTTQRGLAPASNRKMIAAMIEAMDDGFSLHALIDPSRDPVEAFSVALDFLAEAADAIAFVEQHGGPKRQTTRPTRPPKSASQGSK